MVARRILSPGPRARQREDLRYMRPGEPSRGVVRTALIVSGLWLLVPKANPFDTRGRVRRVGENSENMTQVVDVRQEVSRIPRHPVSAESGGYRFP